MEELPKADTLLYGEHQHRGMRFQRWIENASLSNCPIQPSEVTLTQLHANWLPVIVDRAQPDAVSFADGLYHANRLQIHGPWVHHRMTSGIKPGPRGRFSTEDINDFQSYIAPTALFLTCVFRMDGPYVSQIAQAVYQSEYSMGTLEHIFFTDVVNQDTTDFLQESVLPDMNNPNKIPTTRETYTFEHGSPEHLALLGTRLGSVVGYLMLGAYPRGTRRVSRISIHRNYGLSLELQFQIEDIPRNTASSDGSSSKAGDKRRHVGGGDGTDDGAGSSGKRRKPSGGDDDNYQGPARRTRQRLGPRKI
ncbi:hypothetical protein PDE_05940 [Penicillium oxalicum 114-2]|uniref:Uncharacterized protein n=1 Tax=Penicillium oxalicum (strain 114-2 / CGMCC 5302) TaxID=933388 RepID=S7ZQQ2_PENO1|nr:hypothetical protein PDE_05940 [Penicillium oxalicum 114-2]